MDGYRGALTSTILELVIIDVLGGKSVVSSRLGQDGVIRRVSGGGGRNLVESRNASSGKCLRGTEYVLPSNEKQWEE